MGLNYQDLDMATRAAMAAEIDRDVETGTLYISPRLTEQGAREWPDLLRAAVTRGTDDGLARQLISRALLHTQEQSHRNGKMFWKAVPVNAPATLAEGEFNRMYLRESPSAV